ncbi:MAG: GyrI-like domain-containing protein, partial [Pyrinomonadaceae bacterium]
TKSKAEIGLKKTNMDQRSDFEIVELEETCVAGLPIRTNNRMEQELADRGWIAKAWDEIKKRSDPNMPAVIYTGYSNDRNGDFSVVIGFRRSSATDFNPCEVIAKVGAGKFAKFTHVGAMPYAVIEAWQAVWWAEDNGSLHRAYTADLELYSGMTDSSGEMTVELFIAIK